MLTKWIWEWLGLFVFLVALLTGQFGCTIKLADEGSVRLTFGTEIGIESSSSTTHSESKATIESQAFEDWFKAKTGKDPAEGAGEETAVDEDTEGTSEGEQEEDATKVP